MTPRPTVVASDAHLGAAPERAEAAFLAFPESVPRYSNDLLLNGDVFDFWFEYRTAVLRPYFDVLRCLADLVDAGVRIRLVGGNHDAWAGSFLREEVGIELLEGPLTTVVGGRRTYVAHGDGVAGGDLGYRILKKALRSRAARRLFRAVHPDFSVPLVRRISQTPEEGGSSLANRAEALADHAETLLRDDPQLDLVIFGHAHSPELREVGPDRHYLNPGDWIHHCTYGMVDRETVELRRWGKDGGDR